MNGIRLGTVVTSRVRLARNLQNYNFTSMLKDPGEVSAIISRTVGVLKRFGEFTVYKMGEIGPLKAEQLKERYVISKALEENVFSGAVAVNRDESLSIMINEEDHIRSQCLKKGADLMGAYKKLAPLDRWMDSNLKFCKKEGVGYLTACPTNLGTGLRASAMMFLPALTGRNMIPSLYERARQLGLTVRGVFGEGSGTESCLYQVSNEVTLGRSETYIIGAVEKYVKEIADAEELSKIEYYNGNRLKVEDEVFRALGILTNCRKLSYEEFSALLASLKSGVMLGLVTVNDITALDDLLVTARPASLCISFKKEGEILSEEHIYELRAKYVRECLKKIGA